MGFIFTMTGNATIKVKGNLEALLDYQTVVNGNHPTIGYSCFASLFSETPVSECVDLPNVSLTNNEVYYMMFMNCRKLTKAPELPSTTISGYCYRMMFSGCTSLVNPPSELPATSVPSEAYAFMFYGCTSLVKPPKIKATSFTGYTYHMYEMFYGCTNLEYLPKLDALTLAGRVYQSMFSDCSKIKLSTSQTGIYQYPYRIPTIGTGTNGTESLVDMFKNTGGTFKGTPSINTIYYTDHEPIGD